MKGLLERLKHKYGPLPLWAWTSIAGGAGWFYMRRKGASADLANVSGSPDTLPPDNTAFGASDVGDLGGGTAGDLAGGAGTSGGAGSADLGDLGLQNNIDAAKGQVQDFTDWLAAQTQTTGNRSGTDQTDTSGEATSPSTHGSQPVTAKPKGGKAGRPRGKGKRAKRPSPKPPAKKASSRSSVSRSSAPAKHGAGKAGARARGAPRPKAKQARPRATAKPSPATVHHHPETAPKPKRATIGGRRRPR